MDEAGRFMRRAKAMTFCVPTYVRAQTALRVGLKVTLPAELMTMSTSSGNSLCFFFGVAEVCLAMSPPLTITLSLTKPSSALPVTFAQWIERRRSDDIVPNRFSDSSCERAAHGEIDLADVRKAIEQHAQRHLSRENPSSDHENLSVSIDFQ
jgi:hypothetical protein